MSKPRIPGFVRYLIESRLIFIEDKSSYKKCLDLNCEYNLFDISILLLTRSFKSFFVNKNSFTKLVIKYESL